MGLDGGKADIWRIAVAGESEQSGQDSASTARMLLPPRPHLPTKGWAVSL